jgi:hypothetical protein
MAELLGMAGPSQGRTLRLKTRNRSCLACERKPLRYIWSVIRSIVLIRGALCALVLAGCHHQAVRASPPPPPPADPHSEAAPDRHREPPELIAPPPLYGNKVVLAANVTAPAPRRINAPER